ncbi:MAG: hypothetical protein LBL35_06775 [Clostridiales bacterium]|nr:hypothetical protein [Clostridiales bacterium]
MKNAVKIFFGSSMLLILAISSTGCVQHILPKSPDVTVITDKKETAEEIGAEEDIYGADF